MYAPGANAVADEATITETQLCCVPRHDSGKLDHAVVMRIQYTNLYANTKLKAGLGA